MRTHISGSVLALLGIGALLTAAIIWFGRPGRQRNVAPESAATAVRPSSEAKDSTEAASVAAAQDKPKSAPHSDSTPVSPILLSNTPETVDAELMKVLQVRVQDAQGRPLGDAQVKAASKAGGSSRTWDFTTDAGGMAQVRYPDHKLESLDVSAGHVDYSSRKMLWDLKSGDVIPASYTLKLAAEVSIGGIVVDEGDKPVAGAAISLHRFWRGEDGDPNKKGEQAAFPSQKQTTDDQGRWRARGLPTELLDHIGFDVKHPDFVGTNFTVGENATTEKQLRDGTHKTVLAHGLAVHGRVLDEVGNPLSDAKVWSGRRFRRERQETQSDSQGRFGFHNVTAGDTLFSVMAKGRSPDSKTVNVQPGMDEILFRLKPGSLIRAHVQDESGQPVANARVGLEGRPGEVTYEAYEFSTTTDSQGDFTWDGAPAAEATPFYFFHSGFEAKRGVKLASNQDNLVTLRRSRQVLGQVLDATTEQPVTRFTLRAGTASSDNSNLYGVIRYHEFSAADGRFSLTLDEEADDAIAVYADGYADQIQKLPEAQNGIVQLLIHLNPSAGISGIVLAPDGTPAPGVTVAVVSDTLRSFIQLAAGRLRSMGSRSAIATTDAEGRFKISSVPEDGTVLAAGEPGFARAPLAAVRSQPALPLQPWGRIEGTLKIGGQPGAGKELLYNLSLPGITTDFSAYKCLTDDQGQFHFEKVPAGEGALVRLIRTSPNSWTHSDSTAVTVQPGETTQVTLGDTGAVLVGRARFDNAPTNFSALTFEGNLSSQMPPLPAFNSPAEAQAFHKSPEWKAMMKGHKTYAIEMRPDGSFSVDNVAPGDYSLNIFVRPAGERPWQQPPLGNGHLMVTVPDSASPAAPIDIGEVAIQPNQAP